MRLLAPALVIIAVAQPSFALPPISGDLDRLVKELGSDDFALREAATKTLQSFGERALPALESAKASPDPEIRRRVRRISEAVVARRERQQRQPLQGRWQVVGWAEGGTEYSPAAFSGELVIDRDSLRWEFRLEGQTVCVPGGFTLGSDGNHHSIDVVGADAYNSAFGIYRLEGKTLTVCLAREFRPREFDTRHARLVTLRRLGS